MLKVNCGIRFNELFIAFVLALSFLLPTTNLRAEDEDDGDKEIKVQCLPPAGSARVLETYAKQLLIQKGAASVKVSVKIKPKEAVLVKSSELPASLIPESRDSLLLKAAPSSILPDGASGISCAGEYEAVITASGIINNKIVKNAKSIVKIKL